MNTPKNKDSINQDTLNNPIVISAQTGLDGYRLRNFYITNGLQGFVWMIFHFSVVFFFGFLLHNIALVGIFLGFANLIAFVIDIPLGIIQRYVPTRRMFIIAAISQLIATGIFFAFIFKIFGILEYVSGVITPESLQSGTDWFFGSVLNLIGVVIASICYGLTKEINDVSTFGYILSHANPSEYGTILARNNITFGLGSLIGLVLSGVILSFSPAFAVVILGCIIAGFLLFTIKFFDNSLDSIEISDISEFRISVQKWNKENVREYIVETVQKVDLEKIVNRAKYLMLKPKQKTEGTKIPWANILVSSKREFSIIWEICMHHPMHISLFWTITLVLTFGFWDTFASSFLLNFLDQMKPGWSYILLAMIGIPGIVLQETASKIGAKIGIVTIGIIGLALSGGSLVLMGIFALGSSISPIIILSLALINSLGYACGMSTGQNQFLDTYNRIYAEHENLTEINSNASSGPMKVIQNLANVIGLVVGGALLSFGFAAFFIIFGLVILGLLYWTVIVKERIKL
ncbi:MFS transporter [Candidatus Gracilibacteria bacterium]|nr:MFS transporter [Candidatus Gracilibacteria bacterium]